MLEELLAPLASGRPLGLVPAARPRAPKGNRDGRLVAPPRRLRQALSQVVGVAGATGGWEISCRMVSGRASQRAFFGVSALLFAASAAVTIVRCASMPAMGGMPMPGGWTMPMAWMRMCGQTWPGAAASFLGMWVVMMMGMMLPSLVPMLWRYRRAVGRTGETHLGRLTALVGAGYFFVWTVVGMATFPLGVALAAVEIQQPVLAHAVPVAVGVVVLVAGVLQFSAWKARHLAYCREAPGRGRTLPADAGTAWRHGLRLGLHCSYSCAGLTAILLVIGVMDLRAMAVVTAAISVERLSPAGERVARAIGAVVAGAGLFLIARAAGLG
jgi:predicted metal-binding membrane protein